MINEIDVKGFDNKLEYTKLKYPECGCGKCSKFYFNFIAVDSRNTGKTFSRVQLLKHYEVHQDNFKDVDGNSYDLRYFLISPTSSANPVYQRFKYLDEDDIYDTYSDKVLTKFLDNMESTKNKEEKNIL